jgi:uncharacterized protein
MTDDASKRPVPVPTNITRPFWEAARQKRLLIQYDPETKVWQFYPRAIAMASGKCNLQWREVSGRGTVYAFTVTHVPMPGFEDRGPYAIAIIDLDEGVRMLANLVNVPAGHLQIGLRVRVVWENISEDAVYFAFEPDV